MEPSAIELGPHRAFAAGLRAGEAGTADESARQIVAPAHAIAQFFRGVALQIEELHCGEITLLRAHSDEKNEHEIEEGWLQNETESCPISYLAKKIACLRWRLDASCC